MARTLSTIITMIELFQYEFMVRALLGGIAIVLVTSLIGPFLVLRRMSLLGDGLAHLAFGGVALGLLFGIDPILSALAVVPIGSLFVQRMVKKNLFGDAAISLILSFGVGLGILITGIARGFNVDLFSFLIGSILTLTLKDMLLIGTVLIGTILYLLFFYKDLLFMTFNSELAQIRHKRHALTEFLFTIIVALAVVISVRAVGILLVSALLVIPSLIALRLSKSFRNTIALSVCFGLLAMVIGIILSFYLNLAPSGTIVMLLFSFFVLSIFWKRT